MSKEDVTALVFAFNNEMQIERCLESICSQSFASKIHVLVHDDSSTDRTIEIAHKFLSSRDLSWEIISNSTNQYSSGIDFFRRVMLNVDTPYVALCDGDDYWISTDKIEKQLQAMERDSSIAITHHSYEIVNSNHGRTMGVINAVDPNPNNLRTKFLSKNFIGACTVMYRVTAARSVNSWAGYDQLSVPDYPFWGLLALFGETVWIDGLVSGYSLSGSGMSAKIGNYDLSIASLQVRRWLWLHYFLSGKLDDDSLTKEWKLLVKDWQLVTGYRLSDREYLSRGLIGFFLKRLSLSMTWQAQLLFNKVRANRRPRRRQ